MIRPNVGDGFRSVTMIAELFMTRTSVIMGGAGTARKKLYTNVINDSIKINHKSIAIYVIR